MLLSIFLLFWRSKSSKRMSKICTFSFFALTEALTNRRPIISFSLKGLTDLAVTILNPIGQRTEVIDADFTLGDNRFGLDVSAYANGGYFLNLSTASGSSTVKFTVAE